MKGLSAAPFLARYEGLRARLPGPAGARVAAAAALLESGLPNQRDEAWKYTSLRALAELAFHEPLSETGDHPAPLALPELGALRDVPRLVFAGGRLRADLSVLPENLTVSRFAETPAPARADGAIATLNTLLAEDGAILDVPEGADGGMLVLLNMGADLAGQPTSVHLRHRIRLAAGARLTLVDISAGHGTYLHNPVADIALAAGARLAHVRLNIEADAAYHLSRVDVAVAEDAAYDSFTLTLGGALSRAEIHATLDGPRAHATLNAAQFLRGHQHADFTTVVRHAALQGTSRQTVKNVLDGHARAVFQGKIEVARAAQKTDGYQMNQALLLSDTAEIDSKPQLEIYADDVKCSHGATCGALDQDQLFYLVSRGIPAGEARAMLVRAFLEEALVSVTDDAARAVLETYLAGALGA